MGNPNETRSQKAIRMGFGGFIVAASTYYYGLNTPEHIIFPVWALLSGWLFGAGLAFSTVVRGLIGDLANIARKTVPMLNRREDKNDTAPRKPIPTTVAFERIEQPPTTGVR